MPLFTTIFCARPIDFTHLAKCGVVRPDDLLNEAIALIEQDNDPEMAETILDVAAEVEQYNLQQV